MGEPLDLDAILARLEAATPGPWAVPAANVFRVIAPDAPHSNPSPRAGILPPYPWRVVADMGEPDGSAADAAFIANAPTDIAALVAEVERLRADSVPRSALVQVGMHGQHPAYHFTHDATDECGRYGCQPVYVLRAQP